MPAPTPSYRRDIPDCAAAAPKRMLGKVRRCIVLPRGQSDETSIHGERPGSD